LSEGVSASRYQPVESLDMRRKCRGRRKAEDDGEVVGVFEGAVGIVVLGFMRMELMVKAVAGRPLRRDMVFILARSVGFVVAVAVLDVVVKELDISYRSWRSN
jgi:hypothetical protein